MRTIVASLLLGIVLAGSPQVRADEPAGPRAAALWNEGQRLYAEGRFEEAAARFAEGRALEARPEFLYGLGQAARKQGDCRRALEYYRRFIVESRSDAQVEAARLHIGRCEAQLAAGSPTDGSV